LVCCYCYCYYYYSFCLKRIRYYSSFGLIWTLSRGYISVGSCFPRYIILWLESLQLLVFHMLMFIQYLLQRDCGAVQCWCGRWNAMEVYSYTKRGRNYDMHCYILCLQFVFTEKYCNILVLFWKVRVKPGESALAFYTAENRSSTPIVGVSTYNVTPMKVLLSVFPLNVFDVGSNWI
jgi:hypothetical protein